jgi:hypothetical protein
VCARGSFVADVQAVELVQPGEGALDDPAEAAESGAVLGLAPRDQRFDAERSQLATVEVMVVAAICDQLLWPALRPARPAAHRRDRLDQQEQLGAFVAVRAGDGPGERDPAAVGQQVVLRAAAAPVDRARTRRGAPFFAWM